MNGPDARRQSAFEQAEHGVDVVIVGGGITGAGAARDAALRGLRVLLVDKGDWAHGTSSRSSKLVHGGLRYLENYQFGLVMEGTRERHRQHVLNPQLVGPLPFVMPVYKTGRHGLFKINLGLWLYDLLSLFRTPKIHRRLGAAKTAKTVCGLRTEALSGSVFYYDCQTHDARLVLANVLDAARAGATTAARAEFVSADFGADERVTHARLRDHILGRDWTIPCRHLVVCTGPWTDVTGATLGQPPRLRPTKGVHVVVARERLPIDVAVAVTSVEDGRVVFAVPFGNTSYIGTTDTDYSGDLERVVADAADVRYLLATANHFFPDAKLTPRDIRSTWAGLRPLVRTDAATAYKTSREHELWRDTRGVSIMAGGKLTTYRAMAEELVDAVVADLRKHPRSATESAPKTARCVTHRRPLDPELARVADPAVGPADLFERQLWQTHGSLAARVRERMAAHPAECARIAPDLDYVLAQAAVAVLDEEAWTLEDVMVRRTQVFYRAADHGLGGAPAVAQRMAELLGRDQGWVAAEIAAYTRYVDEALACASEASADGLAHSA